MNKEFSNLADNIGFTWTNSKAAKSRWIDLNAFSVQSNGDLGGSGGQNKSDIFYHFRISLSAKISEDKFDLMNIQPHVVSGPVNGCPQMSDIGRFELTDDDTFTPSCEIIFAAAQAVDAIFNLLLIEAFDIDSICEDNRTLGTLDYLLYAR